MRSKLIRVNDWLFTFCLGCSILILFNSFPLFQFMNYELAAFISSVGWVSGVLGLGLYVALERG